MNMKKSLYKFVLTGEATCGINPLAVITNNDVADELIKTFDEYINDAIFDFPMSAQKVELIKRLARARVYEEFPTDARDFPLVAFRYCMAEFAADLELIPSSDDWWMENHIHPRFATALVKTMMDIKEERIH